MGSSFSQVRINRRMKFSLFCSVILVAVCFVDNASADVLPSLKRHSLNCNFFCWYFYGIGGSKEEQRKCMKECQAANNRPEEELIEEARKIDYDCNLYPADLSSVPTKHWPAFYKKCTAELNPPDQATVREVFF